MIILYCSLVLACLYFGVLQSKKLKDREKFYFDYLSFLQTYQTNLSFRQDNFNDLIQILLQRERSDFNRFLNSIMNENSLKIEYMSQFELDEINSQIHSLGNLDSDTEMQQVNFLLYQTQEQLKIATTKMKENGRLNIKMSFLIGLLLVVLLL